MLLFEPKLDFDAAQPDDVVLAQFCAHVRRQLRLVEDRAVCRTSVSQIDAIVACFEHAVLSADVRIGYDDVVPVFPSEGVGPG